MNRKIKLKKFFDSEQTDLAYIAEYESNQDYIEEIISNGHLEDLEFFLPIKLMKYADPLNKAGYYVKALKEIHEVQTSLKKMKRSKYINLCSEYANFSKAVCLGRLVKYSESNIIFKELIIKNSENKKCDKWYSGNQKDKITRNLNPIIYFGIGLYLAMFFFCFTDFIEPSDYFRTIGLVVSLLTILS